MREVSGKRTPSRVRGRAALTRRLRALLLAVHRFGRCRARAPDDIAWAARIIDRLTDHITREEILHE